MFTSQLGTTDSVLSLSLILGNGATILGVDEFIGISEIVVSQDAHSSIAIRAAQSSIVVSQNVLPGLLDAEATSAIAVTDTSASIEISRIATSSISINQATDAVNVLNASNTINLSQDQNVTGPKSRSGSNAISLSQQANVTFGILGRNALNVLDISGTNPNGGIVDSSIRNVTAVTPDPASGDSLTGDFTDVWNQEARLAETFEEVIAQTIPLSQEVPQPTGKRSVDALSPIVFVDDADTQVKTRAPINTLVFNQTADVFKVYNAISVIPISDQAVNGAVLLAAINTITLTQNSTPGPIDRAADSIIVITDTAKSSIRNLFADNTILVSQDINVLRPYRVFAENEISGVTDDIFIPPIGPNIPGVPFGMSDEATVIVDPSRQLSNLTPIGDKAQATHILVDAIDVSASSLIGTTQKANLSQTSDAETIIDSLSVSTDFALNTTDSVNLLILDQDVLLRVKRSSVFARSNLTLRQSSAFSLINDTTDCDYSPFIGTSDSGITAPRATLPEAKFPPLDPSIRFRLVYPPFGTGVPVDTLDLRAPNLGNRERLTATRIQRETVGGTLTVFADPIWPKIHSLQLQFQALKTVQARGLLDFIDRWLGLEVGIYDYEGRCWKGVITNPEEAVIQNGIESYSATLEIEAERVFAGKGEVLATSGVVFSQESAGTITTFPGISPIAINGSADYTKVPVKVGADSISISQFATRNNLLQSSAISPISLNHSGSDVDFSSFGTLIHNWDAREITDPDATSISIWPDSVGQGTINLTSSGSFRPTVRDGILNGERVVEFRHSSSVQRMLSASKLPVFKNKTGTIFIVLTVREAMSNGNNLLFGTNPGASNSTAIHLGGTTSAQRPVAYKSPTGGGLSALETPLSVLGNNTSHVFVWRRNNTNILFRRNGDTKDGTTLSSNPASLSDDMFIGGLASSTSADIDIAQILMYDNVLNISQIKTIESLITNIWGV